MLQLQLFFGFHELRASLVCFCFLLSLKGDLFLELLLKLCLLGLGLLDGNALGADLLILENYIFELINLLSLLSSSGLGLVKLLLSS